jgi:hypothetical protein
LRSASTKVVPPTAMRPPVGRSRPAMQFSVVDFPHPLGPSRVKNSPSRIVNEFCLSTVFVPNCLTSCSTTTSGILVALQQ